MSVQFTGDLYAAGFIPIWLFDEVGTSAVEQIDANYKHGGGWRDCAGFSLVDDRLVYPGDPDMEPKAQGKLRDERILIYDYGWVAVVQPDNTFKVARID